MAHLVSSSTALTFLTNMSGKCKSTSHSAVQVKNWQKTVTSEEKLFVISHLEKGEQIVDICRNVRFPYSSIIQYVIMLIELQKMLSQDL